MDQMASFSRPANDVPQRWAKWKSRVNQADLQEPVLAKRLDAVLCAYMQTDMAKRRIYIKSDTQGWDLEVLRSAERVFSNVIAVQIEVSVKQLYQTSPSFTRSIEVLNELGFNPVAFYPASQPNTEGIPVCELDCIAVRSEFFN